MLAPKAILPALKQCVFGRLQIGAKLLRISIKLFSYPTWIIKKSLFAKDSTTEVFPVKDMLRFLSMHWAHTCNYSTQEDRTWVWFSVGQRERPRLHTTNGFNTYSTVHTHRAAFKWYFMGRPTINLYHMWHSTSFQNVCERGRHSAKSRENITLTNKTKDHMLLPQALRCGLRATSLYRKIESQFSEIWSFKSVVKEQLRMRGQVHEGLESWLYLSKRVCSRL